MNGLLSIYLTIGAYFAGFMNASSPQQDDSFLTLCEAMIGLLLWPMIVVVAIYFKIKKLTRT